MATLTDLCLGPNHKNQALLGQNKRLIECCNHLLRDTCCILPEEYEDGLSNNVLKRKRFQIKVRLLYGVNEFLASVIVHNR